MPPSSDVDKPRGGARPRGKGERGRRERGEEERRGGGGKEGRGGSGGEEGGGGEQHRQACLAVDGECEVERLRVGDGGRGRERAEGRERVEALRHAPRRLFGLGRGLDVPRRHVEAERIGRDVVQRVRLGDVLAAATDHHHDLDLVVDVVRHRRDHDGAARGHER